LELSAAVVCISRTGLFLNSDYLDDIGSMVALGLRLPGEPDLVHLAGRVVRIDSRPSGAGMGVHFTDLSWRSKRLLTRFGEEAKTVHLS